MTTEVSRLDDGIYEVIEWSEYGRPSRENYELCLDIGSRKYWVTLINDSYTIDDRLEHGYTKKGVSQIKCVGVKDETLVWVGVEL